MRSIARTLLALSVSVSAADAQTLYEGARLIAGDGSAVIERSAIVVDDGRISQIGQQAQIQAPANARRIDLAGKTVMPMLIATHVHP
jgi:imidazolonepropionase-like amidohydrolase